MPHNGSRLQVNFNFLNFGGEDAFLNRMKQGARWTLADNSGIPVATTLDANGYPTSISNGGVYTSFRIPSQTALPGNWKCRWTGEGTIIMPGTAGSETIAGNKTGVNGWFTCRPTVQQISVGISAINVANPITNLEFYYEAQESLLDAGEMFTPAFLALCRKFGVLRFLNWMLGNGGGYAKWAHRKPLNYVYWAGDELRGSIYKGATTNTGDAYSINLGDGGTPADKDAHLIVFNATASDITSTLNGKPIAAPGVKGQDPGDLMYSSQIPLTGRQALVIYDAELDKWLKFLGDATGGAYAGLQNGVPPEVMLRLCKEVGAHPWFTMPYLSLDPPTDYTAELAGYAKSYAESDASWMVPRYEPANEDWNGAAGFDQTPYGQAKAVARWGIASTHDHYGRVLSLLGQGISSVYGDDRTKYQVICGVQTMGDAPSGSNARMGGRHVSVDGGSAASLWATHVAVANYYTPSIYGSDTETSMAAAYDAADAAGKLVIAAQYADYADAASGTYVIDTVAAVLTTWKDWAAAFSPAKALTFYEGGYSPDYVSGETQKNALRAASKDAPALATYARKMFSECLRRGGEFPAVFQLSGAGTAWSVFDPDIYRSTEPPQWTAIADVALSSTPIQFRFV